MGCGQGDVTVMEMGERINFIIGDLITVECNRGCSPGQQFSLDPEAAFVLSDNFQVLFYCLF